MSGRILADLSKDELIAMLQARQTSKVSMKISEKGALSVYGLGRWPVTLYASQWRSLLASAKAIDDFMSVNSARLTEKSAD